VVRNAAGLFSKEVQGQALGFFVRSDGRIVSPDDPARPAEILSVLGTGLGPYRSTPPDGFLFDESAGYTIADPVSVVVGDGNGIDPLYAGRSAAGVGVDAVRFQLPPAPAGQALLAVRIRVNGQESNTVYLPVAP
jgi:uncharacterized protein (TIGR03437 family)